MYEGRIFRPPSEAASLILQVTVGCAHNRCTFCTMYKEKQFKIKPLEEVLDILGVLKNKYPQTERIFIADGDALILPMAYWNVLLPVLHDYFPKLKRITSYGTPRDVLGKTDEDLESLKNMGLSMIYMGLETGSDALLASIDKGVTAAEMIAAGKKLKKAKIKQSITVISGLGGRTHWEAHARETAQVLNAMDPEFVGLLTLLLEEDCTMLDFIKSGQMAFLSPLEILEETRLLIEGLEVSDCHFRSNHASNYLALAGHLPEDKALLLAKIDACLKPGVQLRSENQRRL